MQPTRRKLYKAALKTKVNGLMQIWQNIKTVKLFQIFVIRTGNFVTWVTHFIVLQQKYVCFA